MSILGFFKRQPKVEIKEKLINTNPDPQWKTITLGGLGLAEKSATLLEEYIGWTYANIVAVAEAVAEIKIQLFELKKNDEVEEIKEHPVLELLHRPNQSMTKREFVQLMTIYRLLTGESPIRLKGTTPSELHLIDPLAVNPVIGRTEDGFEMVIKYEMTDTFNGQYKKVILQPEEVIYIKNINPRNKWRGVGVVEAAQNSIDTLQYSELYNLNFFKNSAVPFTVLYTDQKLNAEIIERLKNSWNSNYKGVSNAFKTAILEAGLKVERLQSSSKDMDFIEQQKFLRDKLMAMFKTTKIALGITEDVNRANAEASEYVFTKNCIRPKMAQFIESLNEFLLPIFDPDGKYFLDFEDPVPKDRATLINEYSVAVDKWMTRNEIRQLEGYPDLEGGDEIWQPLNLTTMSNPTPNTPQIQTTPQATDQQEQQGTDGSTPVEPTPTEDTQQQEGPKGYRVLRSTKKIQKRDFSEQIAKLKNRNIRLKNLKEELKEQIRKMLKSKTKQKVVKKYEPKYKNMKTQADTDLYVKSLLSNSSKLEAKFNDIMKWKYFQPQMEKILNKIKKGTKFILPKSKKIEKQIGDEFMFDESQYVNLGIDLMTPILKEILLTQGGEAILTVSPETTYSLLDAARKYLNLMPTKIAKSVTETAYERIRKSLAEGIKAGDSVTQLRDRVIEEYKSLEIYQAENIARTEVSRATSFATIDAFKQSGVVEGKKWIVTPDDRLCEFCQSMESEYNSVASLDDSYFKIGDTVNGVDGGQMTVDFDDVDGPPLHNNCRCVLKSVEKIVEKKGKAKEKSEADKVLDELEGGLDGTI